MPRVLYTYFRSSASYRVRIALRLKGLEVEQRFINIAPGATEQLRPEYAALNPQQLVPLLVDGDDFALSQSLAILEYLEELQPQPALLPRDPRGRARVRGLALIAAADGHPLIVPRVRNYLEKEMKADETARNRWLAHWTMRALEAIEGHLARESETGKFCHGEAPTIADICLASQVIGALAYFSCDTKGVPSVMRIYGQCMEIEAFAKAHPLKQPH